MKNAAIYARVSTTNGQSTRNQLRQLKAVAKKSGWKVVGVYEDAGISGAKGRDQRPEFDRMLKDATAREFDIILAWSVDRLGRSLQNLVSFLDEIHALGVDLYLHQQRIDTTTPAGKALFQMCGVFAEFERSIMRERVNAGLQRAREAGKQLGRRNVSSRKEAAVRASLTAGTGILRTAKQCGVGTSVVQRIRREMVAEGTARPSH